MSEYVLVESGDGILQITMNRPEKKNALSFLMYQELTQALLEADENPAVRVVVLSGQGGCFTAGNDLGDFLTATTEPEKLSAALHFLQAISTLKKPVIAAVDGLAIGIGTSMLLHCDLVFGATETKFQLPFTRLGVVPEGGTSLLLPQTLGHRVAFELMVMGDTFGAERARELGIVNEVLPAEEVLARALNAAQTLTQMPPKALLNGKQLLKTSQECTLAEALEAEMAQFKQALQSAESLEAITAILEKRAPDFSGC